MPLPPVVRQRLNSADRDRDRGQSRGDGRQAAGRRRPSSSSSTSSAQNQQQEAGVLSEIALPHDTVAAALAARLIHVRAARAASAKSGGGGLDALLEHIARINDKSVLVDYCPMIVKKLRTKPASRGNRHVHALPMGKSSSEHHDDEHVSLGACVDLMALLEELLKSHYEEYVIAGLDFLSAVLWRWKPQFLQHCTPTQAPSSTGGNALLSSTISASTMYLKIVPFVSMVDRLTQRTECPLLSTTATKLKKQLDSLAGH